MNSAATWSNGPAPFRRGSVEFAPLACRELVAFSFIISETEALESRFWLGPISNQPWLKMDRRRIWQAIISPSPIGESSYLSSEREPSESRSRISCRSHECHEHSSPDRLSLRPYLPYTWDIDELTFSSQLRPSFWVSFSSSAFSRQYAVQYPRGLLEAAS